MAFVLARKPSRGAAPVGARDSSAVKRLTENRNSFAEIASRGACACGGDCPRCIASGVSTHTNGLEDDEREESVNIPLAPPTRQPPAQPQAALSCPATTQVDDVTDLTPAGLQAGYLSGYGIVARMRVLPDKTTWDGKQVTESLAQTSSTCPAGADQSGSVQRQLYFYGRRGVGSIQYHSGAAGDAQSLLRFSHLPFKDGQLPPRRDA